MGSASLLIFVFHFHLLKPVHTAALAKIQPKLSTCLDIEAFDLHVILYRHFITRPPNRRGNALNGAFCLRGYAECLPHQTLPLIKLHTMITAFNTHAHPCTNTATGPHTCPHRHTHTHVSTRVHTCLRIHATTRRWYTCRHAHILTYTVQSHVCTGAHTRNASVRCTHGHNAHA